MMKVLMKPTTKNDDEGYYYYDYSSSASSSTYCYSGSVREEEPSTRFGLLLQLQYHWVGRLERSPDAYGSKMNEEQAV